MPYSFNQISARDWIVTILLNGVLSKSDIGFSNLYNNSLYRNQLVHCAFLVADEILEQSTDSGV